MKWKKSGEIPTVGGYRVYFSGKEDRHEQEVGFLVHKDIVKSVIDVAQFQAYSLQCGWEQALSALSSFRHMHQHQAMMTVKLMSSTENSSL